MICHRKLWLFSNGIQMEHTSDLVYEGNLIHENSYLSRGDAFAEIELDGIKIDFYDRKNKIIHEIKKSKSHEEAHEWQLKYYMYVLKKNGTEGVTGILEYPAIRKTQNISLTETDILKIEQYIGQIEMITRNEHAPDRIKKSKCKNCSYLDFCWSGGEHED